MYQNLHKLSSDWNPEIPGYSGRCIVPLGYVIVLLSFGLVSTLFSDRGRLLLVTPILIHKIYDFSYGFCRRYLQSLGFRLPFKRRLDKHLG